MSAALIREQLQEQIEHLPEDILQQVADFTLFMMNRRGIEPFVEWEDKQWQEFSLAQLFREDDEIEYSLKDAQEIYRP